MNTDLPERDMACVTIPNSKSNTECTTIHLSHCKPSKGVWKPYVLKRAITTTELLCWKYMVYVKVPVHVIRHQIIFLDSCTLSLRVNSAIIACYSQWWELLKTLASNSHSFPHLLFLSHDRKCVCTHMCAYPRPSITRSTAQAASCRPVPPADLDQRVGSSS